jgi:hypothetical protein
MRSRLRCVNDRGEIEKHNEDVDVSSPLLLVSSTKEEAARSSSYRLSSIIRREQASEHDCDDDDTLPLFGWLAGGS